MKNLPIHEVWRQQYRARRYCSHLSQPELNQRLRDIFINMMRLTPEAKIGLPAIDAIGAKWMECWTHALEEMALRHGAFPNGFTKDILHAEPFPEFTGELAAKCAAVLKHNGIRPGEAFIKYGKPEHMTALFERGAMRIQCASYYGSPDHNGAVKDDELSLPLSFGLTREDVLKVVINPQDVPPQVPDQRLDFRYKSTSDYWLFCVTQSVEPRLFVDFNATACVIIKDKIKFRKMLRDQSKSSFQGATYKEGDAVYIDPILPSTANIDIPLSKHFRYAYQEEFRFIWQPNSPHSSLTNVDLKIGSLEGIAELIVL